MTADGGDGRSHRIAQRYVLKRELGSGGMGVVYEALDELLDRPVAVKEVLLPRFISRTERDKLTARVMREARAAARLNHPGAVTIYDILPEQGTTYIVMELVTARTLDELIDQDGPMTPEATARLGLQLLPVLAAAHARGIVHRDVKPANVMVLPDGSAKLTDFGIATIRGDPKLTTTGVVLGSPTYMSPEHASGHESGPPTDLYSLGATLYYAVEGVPPFQRNSPLATMTAVVYEQPRPMSRAGPLGTVIRLLTAKRPEDRPTPVGIAGMLEDIVADRPVHTFGEPAPAAEPTSTPRSASVFGAVPPLGATPAQAPAPTSRPAPASRPIHTSGPRRLGVSATSRLGPQPPATADPEVSGDQPRPPTGGYPVPPSEPGESRPPGTARQFVITMPDEPARLGPAQREAGTAAAPDGPSLVERARARQASRRRHGPLDLADRPAAESAEIGPTARTAVGTRRRSRLLWRSLLVAALVAAAAVTARMVLPERGGAATGTAASAGSAGSTRSGWTTYTHPEGVYSIAIPQGWQVVERDARVTDFLAPAQQARLRVQWTPSKRSPAAALTESVTAFRRTHQGFRGLKTSTRTVAGTTASVADFQYTERGHTIRATHLALAGPERRTYFLEFSTPNADWAKRGAPVRDQIERGFRPAA